MSPSTKIRVSVVPHAPLRKSSAHFIHALGVDYLSYAIPLVHYHTERALVHPSRSAVRKLSASQIAEPYIQ